MLEAVLQETDETKFDSYRSQLIEDLPSLNHDFSS